jgi:alkylresorcinol/alkylpyrone synthase
MERFGLALGASADRLALVFDHAGIETRHFAMPFEWFHTDRGLAERNECYVREGLALAERVATECLTRAGITAAEVDHIVVASTTGLSAPSLEAHLVNRLGLRSTANRTPLWGLGCAGGVAGLARAVAFTRADPEALVLFIALELCSLTFQQEDYSRSNFIASSLFSDGAAAVLVAGDGAQRNGAHGPLGEAGGVSLRFDGAQGHLWPDSTDVMGWEINDDGLKVLFSSEIPKIVHDRVRPTLEAFLAPFDLTPSTVDHYAIHPGGPRVMTAYRDGVGVPDAALGPARAVLREFGNMSSPTCLFVLERVLEAGVKPGERILVAALGPGFAAEYLLASAIAR